MTPDPEVNRGVLWAKANMLRSQLFAPTGWCFVNDPTRSNNSVARDTAWFAYGSDYVTPEFSRQSLLAYLRNMERKGMVVEYYDIRTGKTADYSLNINDNTPLLYARALASLQCNRRSRVHRRCISQRRKKPLEYILSQRDDRGLVWCTSTGTSDWGICGWRNVIKDYRLSGATTELNSECFAALDAVSKMAGLLGKDGERDRFAREAQTLRDAINEHLVNPDTGLILLEYRCRRNQTNRRDLRSGLPRDVRGRGSRASGAHHQPAQRRAVLDAGRHSHASARRHQLWTDPRIRIARRGLGRRHVLVSPSRPLASTRLSWRSALRESFKHYSNDPRRNNTVPGQFSEWLHGETLMNQGMMLSPWFPPRYLWAAIEGAAGLDLTSEEPSCNPRSRPIGGGSACVACAIAVRS